jgi:hypothetical protein
MLNRTGTLLTVILSMSCLLSACQTATRTGSGSGVTVVGKPIRIASLHPLNPDCTVAGYAIVRILSGPNNGSIDVARQSVYPSYLQNDQKYHCNLRKVQGTTVTYNPNRSFTGTDVVVVESIFPNGANTIWTYTITVK